MSAKSIEAQLKKLGMKNDIAGLEACVRSVEDEKICSLITHNICHSDAPQLLTYLYQGMTQNSSMEVKRFKATERVLKELQSQKLQSKQMNAIVSRLALEVEKLTPAHLVQFCEFCIHCIQHDDGEQTSWKDLLPKLLSVLDTNDSVNHAGIDMTGSEYKAEVIRTLLMVQWRSSIVTSLSSMFIEVPLSTDQHLQVVNKLCASFEELSPPEIPPLVHQLLQLCKNEHGSALFLRLQSYFCTRLYNRLLSSASESENTNLAAITDSIGLASESETQYAEATVLFHIHQSASFGHASIKNFLKFMKSVVNAPELVLDPFLLTVLLSLSTISIYEQQVFDILKYAMQRVVQEEERKMESAWLRDVTPSLCNIELVLTKLMENSLRERSSVMEGMVNLAFILLGAKAAKGRETVAEKLWKFGSFILVKLIKKHNEAASTVLQRLTDCIITGQAVTQYTDCLYQMSVTVPLVLNEHRAIITMLFEMLTQLPGSVAENVVYAMLPVVRSLPSLRDVLIMVLRKALFACNLGTRKMAVSGFLQLLKHLDVKGMAVLSSSQSSHLGSYSNSHGQPPGRSLLTQIDMETASGNNEAICLELLGVLRRCFMQQADVRLCLYEGLHSAVARNPELRGYVQDMLINHFSQFYQSDSNTLPPLIFTKAVRLRDDCAELQEPLGQLVFSIQQVATTAQPDSSSTKLTNILQSLCERMLKCSLEDFGLKEATDLMDLLPESQQQQQMVQQMLGVFEALMGYTISSWTTDTSAENAQKLNNLFKGYSKVADFAKSSGKAVKKTDGNGDGTQQPNRKDGSKKAAGKGRLVTFKFPHTVLDYHVTHRMLCVVHTNSLTWCTTEAANQVQGRRGFSLYVMEVALTLVKASRTEKHMIFKSASRLSSYIKIGSVLYTHCVVKLQEFIECDAGTAALALECFNELFGLVCSHYKDKLGRFLGEVGTVPIKEGLAEQLLALVSKHEELLISILSVVDEAEDEAAIKKIILLLIQGLTQFTLQIPCYDACSKVLNWVKTFVREKVLSNVNQVKGILSLLFTLEVRCKGTSQLYDHTAMQLCRLMGTVDDEEVGAHTSYSVIKTGYESAVLFLLCDTVKQMLEHVDWVLLRLRAEYTAMTQSVADRLQVERERLKSKECDVVQQVGQCVQILNYVSNLALEPGPVTDAVLKLLTHQYASLSMLTKYFIFRSTKKNPSFQSVRFEMVVKLAGKCLSPRVYSLISHIEARQKNESGTKKKKKKKADPLLMKSKVLRETRFIPQLVFEIEQYEKFVIELSKKSKVNLMSYVKLNTYRDFRIKANLLQATDNQNQSVNSGASDSVMNGEEGQENGHDSSSVNEPPRKKARKK